MEREDNSPDFSDGSKFSTTEIAQFQSEYVIPALNAYLWRGDFLEQAQPGCKVSKLAPFDPEDSSRWAEIEMLFSDEEEAIIIDLNVYEQDDDLLLELIKGYKTEYIEAQKKNPRSKRRVLRHIRAPRIKSTEHLAWKVTTFNFFADSLDGFSVSRRLELRDASNEAIWSTNAFMWQKSSYYKDVEADQDIADLNELFNNSITDEDMFLIMDAFKALNIAPEHPK